MRRFLLAATMTLVFALGASGRALAQESSASETADAGSEALDAGAPAEAVAPPAALQPEPAVEPPREGAVAVPGEGETNFRTTVTGQREAPAGASEATVSREQLQSLPGGDTQPLSHALATQPGFVMDTFGFGLHVRGADGGLLYVIDGIPMMAAPLTSWAGTVDFIPRRLVQNVRILTGGFPAEFGNGQGAVVDVTTRHALGGPAGEAQISHGTYATTNASLDYSQEIGSLSLFVGGDFDMTSRGLDPPSVSPILHDELKTGSGFARLDYRATAQDRVELIASYAQSRLQIPIDPTILPLSQAPAGAARGPDRFGNDPVQFVPYDANPVETERDLFAALSYSHVGELGILQVAPFFHETYSNLSCDPAGSLGATADPGSSCSDARRDIFHGGALGRFTWKLGGAQTWKAGALVDYSRSSLGYSAYFRDDASPLGGPVPSQTLTGSDVADVVLAGVFVQDEIAIDRWTVLPGLRLDFEETAFPGSDEPSQLLVGPSARLGVNYAVSDSLSLRAFAGYLWQPPNTVDAPAAARVLIPSLAGQVLPNDLKAEKDWTAEVGLVGRPWQALTLGLTVWGRLAQDQIDRINVGTTSLMASYNFARGRAAGAEAFGSVSLGGYVDGFANVGWQLAQGQGISSAKYLFSADEIADQSWVTLDHVQSWTVNAGFDLHDVRQTTHLSALMNYGSGLRTGADSTMSVPEHVTFDFTLRHRFDFFAHVQPEVAIDVLNAFNEVYAYRIGTGYIGSAYGPLRRVAVRLAIPFSG